MMQRRQMNMPPITMAEYYTKIQNEGIDPLAAPPPELEGAAQKGDLTYEAAQNSKSQLSQILEHEKSLRMQGKTPSKHFSWEEDSKSDMTWDK